MNRGRFIVLDGGDGSGKGTVIRAAQKEFSSDKTVFTREPGGTTFADKIRELILSPEAKDADANTMFSLYLASRADHVEKLIRPAINSGRNVICDRFDASTYAYQIRAQEGHHLKLLFDQIHEVFCGDVRPYLYIYLNVDPEVGAERTRGRGDSNHFDERKLEFHANVRKGYLEFISSRPHQIINANRSEREVVKEALMYLHRALD